MKHIRILLIVFGWIWLAVGAAWVGMYAAIDVPMASLFHAAFDTGFGAFHFWAANKFKDQK